MIPPRNEITVLHPLTHDQSVDVVERVMRVFREWSTSTAALWCSEIAMQRALDIEFGLTEAVE